jgi:hypothetical protein
MYIFSPASSIPSLQYHKILNRGKQKGFLFLPILLVLLYIPSLLTPTSSTSTSYAIIIPGITSLLSTAYALWSTPSRAPSASSPQSSQPQGPIEKYLDHLNAILCILLLPFAWKAKSKGREDDMWFSVMPGVVFVVVYAVRTQLKPVDIAQLEKLKYGYKGA